MVIPNLSGAIERLESRTYLNFALCFVENHCRQLAEMLGVFFATYCISIIPSSKSIAKFLAVGNQISNKLIFYCVRMPCHAA
jgi:hypothetical protein